MAAPEAKSLMEPAKMGSTGAPKGMGTETRVIVVGNFILEKVLAGIPKHEVQLPWSSMQARC